MCTVVAIPKSTGDEKTPETCVGVRGQCCGRAHVITNEIRFRKHCVPYLVLDRVTSGDSEAIGE